MANLLRQDTQNFARMMPKATIFNDVIESRKEQWDKFVSALNNSVINAALDNSNPFSHIIDKCTGTSYTIDSSGVQIINEHENFPKIFLVGGGAYSAYGKYFENLGHTTMEQKAPRTHDWDIAICLQVEITNSIIKLFKDNLIKFIEQNINIVIDSTYLLSFVDIDQGISIGKEASIYLHSTKKIELTILQNRRYTNFRINMALNIKGVYTKGHLIEFVLWTDTSPYKMAITKLNYLTTTNGITYVVPIVSDLVLLTVRAIIERSLKPYTIPKCRQDYSRLKYICEALSLGGVLLEKFNIGSICNIASYIISMLPQCTINLSEKDFSDLKEQISQPEKQTELEKNKNKIIQYLKDNLHSREQLLVFSDQLSYETKYLKYKQKYLMLKNFYKENNN
jgi:hypothetical protein